MTEKFKQLGICENSLKAIKELGFSEPTEIQGKTIPLVLEGKDVIAGASTGSGKTLAFGTGLIHNSEPDFGVQGLVLTPTRELAEQITKELNKFKGKKDLKIAAIYGGVSMQPQIEALRHADIVVATPGRILDHLSRRTLNLEHLKILVLDEADRMLDMGFRDDVERIINSCPKKRQTLLFSATISEEISQISKKYMNQPQEISAEQYVDPSKLKQIYYDVEDGLKYSLLKHLLENEKAKLVMVFCNTRRNVDFVANNLNAMGIESLPIHGGFSQDKRTRIMKEFHSNKVHVLICTDVAARGLDIKGVTHVYNYDLPADSKEYIHRIGRTARAGEEGIVINIVTSKDYENFSNIINSNTEFKIELKEIPEVERARIRWIPERKNFSRGRGRDSRTHSRDSGDRSRGPRSFSRGDRDSRSRSRSFGNNRRTSSNSRSDRPRRRF